MNATLSKKSVAFGVVGRSKGDYGRGGRSSRDFFEVNSTEPISAQKNREFSKFPVTKTKEFCKRKEKVLQILENVS